MMLAPLRPLGFFHSSEKGTFVVSVVVQRLLGCVLKWIG